MLPTALKFSSDSSGFGQFLTNISLTSPCVPSFLACFKPILVWLQPCFRYITALWGVLFLPVFVCFLPVFFFLLPFCRILRMLLAHFASQGASDGVATLEVRKGAFDALNDGSGALEKCSKVVAPSGAAPEEPYDSCGLAFALFCARLRVSASNRVWNDRVLGIQIGVHPPDLLFLAVFENGKENHQKGKEFFARRTPQILGKERKKTQNRKEFLEKEKGKEIRKRQGKED